jgi:hypothetical protein
MRNSPATLIVMLTVSASLGAQSPFTEGWPTKYNVSALQVDSSAPGLLPSGTYGLDLQVVGNRLVGRLTQGAREYEIPFSVDGCRGVKSPKWATRATARGLPPASGSYDRRVELTLHEADAKGCTIRGSFTTENDPVPGSRPGGGPDQQLLKPLPDLRIRATKPDPDDPTKLRVQVSNDGAGSSAATQVKFFYHKDGKVVSTQSPLPMLAAKQSAWVTVGAGLPIKSADMLGVRADDPNMVPETNELNNSHTVKAERFTAK